MESPTKERLTGGLIFVALLVIVPEMLFGPGPKPAGDATPAAEAGAGPQMRTYDLVLDPAARQDAPQESLAPRPAAAVPSETVVVAAATEPAAQAAVSQETAEQGEAPERDAPQPAATVAPVTVAATPSPTPASTPTAAAPAGRWWVQLGRFSARENAERLAADLRRAGYTTALSQIRADGKELTLVRAGPVADRAAAAALQKKLAAAGHGESFLVPP